MKYRENKGVSVIDISIAIGVIIIFSALIANLFLNVSYMQKQITRESDATYIAIKTIEAIKGLDYDDVEDITDISSLNSKITSISSKLDIPDEYLVAIEIKNYKELMNNDNLEDLIKKIDVTVSYKYRNENKQVKLETVIVNGGE